MSTNPQHENSLVKRRRQQERLKRRRKKKIIRAIVLALLFVAVVVSGLILKSFFDFLGSIIFGEPKDKAVETVAKPQATSASILSVGDIILHSPIFNSSVYHIGEDSYEFDPIFNYVKEDLEKADFTVANFEGTISDSDYSGFPLFRFPSQIATSLSNNGVDLCLLANNHIYDNGTEGLSLTMSYLDSAHLLYTGTRKQVSDSTYLIQDINGIKVGILNYVFESDGSVASQKIINSLSVSSDDAPLINSFNYSNLDAFYNEVQETLSDMETDGVEYTVAYIHWGNEYQLTPDSHQEEIAQELCDLGVNVLIGNHPHVVQPIDLLTSTDNQHQMFCAYSIGNFISNQRRELISSQPDGYTEDGLMINMSLEKTAEGTILLTDVTFIPTWVYKSSDETDPQYFVLPLDDLDAITNFSQNLGVQNSIDESLNRTNSIIQEGVKKLERALPLS